MSTFTLNGIPLEAQEITGTPDGLLALTQQERIEVLDHEGLVHVWLKLEKTVISEPSNWIGEKFNWPSVRLSVTVYGDLNYARLKTEEVLKDKPDVVVTPGNNDTQVVVRLPALLAYAMTSDPVNWVSDEPLSTEFAPQQQESSMQDQQSSFDLFSDRVSTSLKTEIAQFDPLIILMLLAAIIPLIQNCPLININRLRQRFGNRALIVAALKQSHGLANESRAELRKMADAVLDTAEKSSDDELRMFVKECCEG